MALAVFAMAGTVGAEVLLFDCSSVERDRQCQAASYGLHVEVDGGGARRVAFLLFHHGGEAFVVDRVYLVDAAGVLVGPPDLLNKEPDVSFHWKPSKQGRVPIAVGGHILKTHSDLNVAAQPPGAAFGLNTGESLGLVYEIAGGLELGDVLRHLQSRKLLIAAGTTETLAGSGPARTDPTRTNETGAPSR